ncbi:MAG: hypothetical protein MJ237_00810 [bacterium]|nr:hypothetical protein [bacterium]
MIYKYGVTCSETLSNKWTQSAVDCYLIGCSCQKCNLYRVYFSTSVYKCQMKNTVIDLVRKVGVPEITEYDFQEQKMVL